MAFLSKGKKIDLYNLASELRVSVTLEDKIIDLREKITSCTFFQNNEQFVKEMLDNIVDERKSLEIDALKKIEREDKFLADQRAFELEKLKLQAQNPPASVGNSSQMDSNPMRLDLKTVLPTFIPDKDDISLFLTMFERQIKLLNVPADFWVSHLIGVLPSDIGSRSNKKRCPPDYKNHFLDTWEILNDPVVLAGKLDSYENVKPFSQKLTKLSNSRFSRNTGNPEFRKSHSFKVEKNVSGNHNSAFANPSYIPARNTNTGFHPPISCYGCGNPGIIKSKCPKCSQKKESASVNAIHMFTCLTSPVALLDIEVYEATGTVCADTGASQSLGGELMFKFLRNRGQKFSEFHLAMCLADGQQSTSLVQKATVPITVGGRTFQIDLIFLPHAKGNRTLLGVDFLRTSGIVMDMRNNFCEIPLHSNTVKETETNDLHLREEEGQALNVEERNDLTVLLNESKDVFRLGGEPTPFVKHFINTSDHPPVSTAPYRLSPNRKEHLRKEIDNLLAHNIEECESPYAAPVVLVPKSNGTVRLCIDYRKLNAITIPDKYPLPLMDVLLHDAKSTAFMSTLDLKSGYHQVEVNPADQDKTAFVCPFGTFRYKRMPFGLRNAPATFQRLMDQFRNGLPNVNILVYLDDIVVLSETPAHGIENSFIPNFSDIASPLSNLSKKSTAWKWSEIEQQAFQTLKQCLITPPILRKVDPKKPFIIRTDASSYALDAVLLQGESPTDEQPVEYASRLLSSAEKNYSTTEREALAVVWALNKFRGYIEGSEITVASDHQPLKWLMNLTSPTGRLARWTLQIQSYNLKIDYFPGKCNFIADMLSRPEYRDEEICELKTIIIDFPTRTANELRTEQLKDLELKKIVDCFENPNKGVDFANWTGRGYVMNQGVLYRYSPHAEVEEAQLVVPTHEREKILKLHHDAPTAAHYGADGTFSRISSKYYWTGMRKFIADYVKSCSECIRYKATNQKPAGLLQTPVPTQRFESIAIDLFGPLPETTEGMKWIFIVEDYTTKWVELFPLKQATAKECAMTLLNEVFLRYGVPRRLLSDNGTQFVSAVMQQLCFVLDINQSLIPVYHPQANPVERKNRDLKPRLAMMVGNNHTLWTEKLPAIRFALNTSKCESTDHTAAYLTFARELRTLDQVNTDLRSVIHNDNFVPEFTPYLKRFEGYMSQIK
ncbi:transposon Tf2-6 polyprotein [Trichonephila clavipes]|nr:transposon Tf2-6 polyprotein [Trichonephila clavipes]